jgi:DNA-3-methyladenine glycosylase
LKAAPEALRRLSRAELPPETATLARFLIGKILSRALPNGPATARIVETEAYYPDDAASHSFRGPTPRNRSMYLRRGHAYVYIAYGVHRMLNVSSDEAGVGAAVLIRAAEPLGGIDVMRLNRGTATGRKLLRGPGCLAKALQIDLPHDGIDLCASDLLWLGADSQESGEISVSARIGISRDAHRPLRFFLKGSAFVSGPAAFNRSHA